MTTSFEDRLRDDLHAAVGGASFDELDATSLIGLGQRAVRRRRLSCAVAAAAVSLTAVVVGVGLGATGAGRAVAPPAGTTSSSSVPTTPVPAPSPSADGVMNPGTFGSRAELRPAGTGVTYTVRGITSEGHRFAALEESTNGTSRVLAGLRLDRPGLADVAFTDGPIAVLVTPGPVESIEMGSPGPMLQHVGSAPIHGTTQWVTIAALPATWTKPWEVLGWSSLAGGHGQAQVAQSSTATIPAKSGGAGWSVMPVRFTARPALDGAALVEVEKADGPSLDLHHLGSLVLAADQTQSFARGDGAAYATLYGLTRAEPVSVTPKGDTATRFADGWTFTTVEVADGVWATAIQLSGMDDSSTAPVPSVSWTDSAGATHTFDLP